MMKKFMIATLAISLFGSMSMVGQCLHDDAKKSIYLNKDSWVVSKINDLIGPGKKYSGLSDWKDKIVVNYSCVDSGMPEGGEMKSIIKKESRQTVNLKIPAKMNANDDLGISASAPGILSATVTFKTPVDNIEEKMERTELPQEANEIKILNLGFGSSYEAELNEMADKEKEVTVDEFTFDAEVKIYSAGLGTYMGGFILKDKNGKKLFWSPRGTVGFEGKKFHKLDVVLKAYEQYVKTSKESQASGYPNPFGLL